jgi:hypothetical protein
VATAQYMAHNYIWNQIDCVYQVHYLVSVMSMDRETRLVLTQINCQSETILWFYGRKYVRNLIIFNQFRLTIFQVNVVQIL